MMATFIEYSALWSIVSAGVACLVVAIGLQMKDDVSWQVTMLMALAAATLWPLFTAFVVGFALLGAAVFIFFVALVTPVNIVRAMRGQPSINPFPKVETKAGL
jgi:hypothetical protein